MLIGSKSGKRLNGSFTMNGGKTSQSSNADVASTSNEITPVSADTFTGITDGFFIGVRPSDKYSLTYSDGKLTAASGTAFLGPILLTNSDAIERAKAALQNSTERPASTPFTIESLMAGTVNAPSNAEPGSGNNTSNGSTTTTTFNSTGSRTIINSSSDNSDDENDYTFGISKRIIVKLAFALGGLFLTLIAIVVYKVLSARQETAPSKKAKPTHAAAPGAQQSTRAVVAGQSTQQASGPSAQRETVAAAQPPLAAGQPAEQAPGQATPQATGQTMQQAPFGSASYYQRPVYT